MQPQTPRTFSDIMPPKPSPSSRPIIVNNQPVRDPTVTRIEVNSPPPVTPSPRVTPQQFAPLTPIQPIAPAAQTPPVNNFVPVPSTPPAQPPKFGMLQSKVDAHPLFSGAREEAPKKPRGLIAKLLWTIAILLVILATVYVVIDSGAVNTNINLPFHIFKQTTSSLEEI